MASSQRTAASWLLLLGTTLSGLVAATPAFGFCQTTTCSKANCATDSRACVSEGASLAWESDCLTLNLQADAAPSAGIDYEAAKASLERAAEAWMSAECPGGGNPSIRIEIEGAVACNEPEYNSTKRNANVVMFREDAWPYTGQSADTLGFTNLNFDPDGGALYDADIEINATEKYAVGRLPKADEADLDSVLTHEVGHLLGLGHTLDVSATMASGYVSGTYELRTLGRDDIEGICAIYPPERKAQSAKCEPRHGFSELCGAEQPEDTIPSDGGSDDGAVGSNNGSKGCSVSRAPSGGTTGAVWFFAILAASVVARRKRRPVVARSQRNLVRVLTGCGIVLGCSRLTAPDWSLIPAPSDGSNQGGDDAGGAPPTQPQGGQAGAVAGGEGGVASARGEAGEGGEAASGTSGSVGSGGKGGAGGSGGAGGKGGAGGVGGTTGGTGGSGGGGGSGGSGDHLTPTPCTGSPGPLTDAMVLFAGPAKPTAARGGRAGLDADCEAERVRLNLAQTKTHAFISVSQTDYIANWGVPDWVPGAEIPTRQFVDLPVLRRIVGPTGIEIAASWRALLVGEAANSLICGAVLPSDGFWWLSGNEHIAKQVDITRPAVFGQFAGDLQTCNGWTLGQHVAEIAARPGSAEYAGSRLLAAAEAATAPFFLVSCDATATKPILCLAYTP